MVMMRFVLAKVPLVGLIGLLGCAASSGVSPKQDAPVAPVGNGTGRAGKGGTDGPGPEDPAAVVRKLFESKCSECHELTGEGGTDGPDLRDYNSRQWIADFLRNPTGVRFMGGATHEKPMDPVEGTDGVPDRLHDLVRRGFNVPLFGDLEG